jgi:hypothetical protein
MKKSVIKTFSITPVEDEKLKKIGLGSRTSGIKKLLEIHSTLSLILSGNVADKVKLKMLKVLLPDDQ